MSYTAAHTLDEAIAAMADGARPVAGGSDLVVAARHGKSPLPGDLVAIHGVGELAAISVEDGALVMGALVNHAEIEANADVHASWTGLADGSALVGSPATSYVGTIGGNVMNSSPAMDTGAPLLVLGAEVELRSKGGSRSVPVSELWTGPGRTSAREDELLVSVRVPAPPARSGSAYLRLEYRRAMEIAVVGAAAFVTLNGDGDVEACRIALTAVAPTIVRSPGAEAAIVGKPLNEETLAAGPLPRAPTRRRSPTSARASATAATPSASWPAGPSRPRPHARAASTFPYPLIAPRASAPPSEAQPMSVSITMNVNGQATRSASSIIARCLSVVRGEIGLTGTKEGCDDCECGACMVLVDGRPVNSCSYLAVQTDGREVTTVEGLGTTDEPHPLQRNIVAEGGVQCGFCTPGMLISATALLAREPAAERGRDPHRAGRQPVPLHRLPEDRPRGPAHGRRAGLGTLNDSGGAAAAAPPDVPRLLSGRRSASRCGTSHMPCRPLTLTVTLRLLAARVGRDLPCARRDVAGDVTAALEQLAREPRAAAHVERRGRDGHAAEGHAHDVLLAGVRLRDLESRATCSCARPSSPLCLPRPFRGVATTLSAAAGAAGAAGAGGAAGGAGGSAAGAGGETSGAPEAWAEPEAAAGASEAAAGRPGAAAGRPGAAAEREARAGATAAGYRCCRRSPSPAPSRSP